MGKLKHGQISVSTMKVAHAKQHIKIVTDAGNESRDYGGHGDFSQQGAFSPGGAAGANYETTSVEQSDCDSQGATGY
jgi:hypothetical protein